MHYTMEKALVVARGQVAGHLIPREPWYQHVPDEGRSYHRDLGRRMLGLLVQFVARENSNDRIVSEGRQVAVEMAAHNIRMGLSLTDAMRSFMYFRDSLIDALVPALNTPGEMDSDDLAIYRKARMFLNDIFCTMLETYEQLSSGLDSVESNPSSSNNHEQGFYDQPNS